MTTANDLFKPLLMNGQVLQVLDTLDEANMSFPKSHIIRNLYRTMYNTDYNKFVHSMYGKDGKSGIYHSLLQFINSI